MSKSIIKTTTYEIDKPQQVIKMAVILKDFIVKNNLSVRIVNRDYVLVEGWQFAGGLMGLNPRIVKVEKLDDMKWLAQAEIVNIKTKEVVGSGYALCSKAESKKSSFDEYAILSMAQTRAIGKAYRNLIGWVVKMAGYEATPAEEMKITPKIEKMTKETAYKMTLEKINSCEDKKELNQMKDKLVADKKVFTQKQVFELLEKINAKLGIKK